MKLVILVFCAVLVITQSEKYNQRYGPYMQGYTRIKRVKYSSPPQRFYSRPPAEFPGVGTFSYTPPPGYMLENDEPPYPGSYPGKQGIPHPKVSRPNEGLREEDLQNFAKYLSKQDLDKILEYARNRDREMNRDRPTDEYRNNGIQDLKSSSPKQKEDIFNALVKEIDVKPKFNPYQEKQRNENPSNFDIPFVNKFNDVQVIKSNTVYSNTPNSFVTEPTFDHQLHHDKPIQEHFLNFMTDPKSQSSYTDPQNSESPSHIQQSIEIQNTYTENDISDSKMIEEILPRPLNLRDDEFEVSFTHNVPSVLKADSNYEVKNFGVLPLMNYNSKLDKLSSYHVPHYTVTSSESVSPNAKPSSYSAPPSLSSSSVPVEPAPPPSAAREQSDAHLKAIKIWSHRSKGTAYTLHDDGTLSLEKPGKPIYGS